MAGDRQREGARESPVLAVSLGVTRRPPQTVSVPVAARSRDGPPARHRLVTRDIVRRPTSNRREASAHLLRVRCRGISPPASPPRARAPARRASPTPNALSALANARGWGAANRNHDCRPRPLDCASSAPVVHAPSAADSPDCPTGAVRDLQSCDAAGRLLRVRDSFVPLRALARSHVASWRQSNALSAPGGARGCDSPDRNRARRAWLSAGAAARGGRFRRPPPRESPDWPEGAPHAREPQQSRKA